MDKYKEQLKNYECLIIPTKNIFDMHEDELGCIKITVGSTEEDEADDVLMVFADDIAIDGKYYQEGGEDE